MEQEIEMTEIVLNETIEIPKLDVQRSKQLNQIEREISDTILKRKIDQRFWYHRIDLGNGIVTPGFPWEGLWNNSRKIRKNINYQNKTVLDLGSWDGLWAFEAEALEASLVVATDCTNHWQLPWHQGMNNLLLIREAIFSEIIPYWNVSPMNLRESLGNILNSHPLLENGFDIVHHMGLLYHLRDPMFSLAQTRSVIREGGTLLLETAIHGHDTACVMHFNERGSAIYDDFTTWWAPTLTCLRELLRNSLFEIKEELVVRSGTDSPFDRVSLIATAIPPGKTVSDRYNLDPGYCHGFSERFIKQVPFNDVSFEFMERYCNKAGFDLKKTKKGFILTKK